MKTWIPLALLLLALGCRNPDGRNQNNEKTDVAFLQQFQTAIDNGNLRFELKSLKTTATQRTDTTYFSHNCTVIAVGDEKLRAGRYWVLFSVKRLSGGDPNLQRSSDSLFGFYNSADFDSRYASTLVADGVGNLEIGGGARKSDEKWEPEKIEVTTLGVVPWIPLPQAPSVRSE